MQLSLPYAHPWSHHTRFAFSMVAKNFSLERAMGQSTGWGALPIKCKRSFLDTFLKVEGLEGTIWMEKKEK